MSSDVSHVLQWRLPAEEGLVGMRDPEVVRYTERGGQQQQEEEKEKEEEGGERQDGERDLDKQIQQLLVLSPRDRMEERLSAACAQGEDACHLVAGRQADALLRMMREKAEWLAERRRRRERDDRTEPVALPQSLSDVQSRAALTLLCPLLESQARSDPSLRATTAILLRDLLRGVPPQSLPEEDEGLERLQGLLADWLLSGSRSGEWEGGEEEEALLAECLVSLVCARDSLVGLVEAADVLMRRLPRLTSLPGASDAVDRLGALEGGPREPVNVCHPESHRGTFSFNNEPMSDWRQDVSG